MTSLRLAPPSAGMLVTVMDNVLINNETIKKRNLGSGAWRHLVGTRWHYMQPEVVEEFKTLG